ncbi:MAG: 2-C-methyl-D-erythritol 4-phosphate cytidylyltransferase [Treponema sp.]|nr:2-C-methyl-D-erythritol 4-phosphate cytidylyltransferase [Treponema sp.]MCL2252502.1 2-C-methyl-D-erythritol 4-phosphate cytidylyltransferase [Treponema sp.]
MPVPPAAQTSFENSICAVILAAGASSRMGGKKKEFLKLKENDELTVLGSSVNVFISFPEIQTIIIVVCAGDEEAARNALPAILKKSEKKIEFVKGGSTRRASVFNALSFLDQQNEDISYVLIHDGARPWLSKTLVANIITTVKKYGAVIPLLPLTDTPKECDAQFQTDASDESKPVFIKTHLKRANTGIAQTPQGFKFKDILYAHQKAAQTEEDFTDDAEVWGKFCGQVAVIQGEQENKKITFPEDLS